MRPVDCPQKIKRWRSIIDLVTRELTDLIWQREQIRLIGTMTEENAQLKASQKPFLWDARRWYMVFAVMAIRRQADADKDVLSLRRVLEEIKQHPECISRNMVVKMFAEDGRYANDANFEKMLIDGMWSDFAAPDGTFDKPQVARDISHLISTSKEIKKLGDKSIAHATKQGQKSFNLTFNDLDKCIDDFERLAVKYIRLLTGASYSQGSLLPIQQYDWYEQFRFAWKPLGA